MSEIYITSKKLCETLGINGEELLAIEQFFASDPDDEWDLKAGSDYRVAGYIGGQELRDYTSSGAFAIADYLQFKKQAENGWFRNLIQALITAIKGNVRKVFVKQQILNNCSSLVLNSNRYFLSTADAVAIFRTRSDYLRKMAVEAQKDDKTTLIKDEDYIDLPDKGIYYSLPGLMKLGQVFAANITRRNRKDWCGDVTDVITPCVNDILNQIKVRNLKINTAIQQAKNREKKRCQVTGKKGTPAEPIQMAGHHLYSRAEYPHLVDSVDNIICITCEVHDHFHRSMGGATVACTLDDFEAFVVRYYPESNVLIWLQQQRLKLGDQKAITPKERHVLHLPWPIPKLLSPGN
ncbi:MAG TPA: hypothetical protein V6D19_21555 [Stenomitos sp.]